MSPNIQITVIRSRRKTLALRITGTDTAEVRAPQWMTGAQIEAYVAQSRSWLEKHLEQYRRDRAEKAALPCFTEEELRALGRQALEQLPPRIARFAGQMGVSYGKITVRHQKTRWGSCSGKGNLSFNCLLMLCPPAVQDYVIVHELCHRKEMNHSRAFWSGVERILPDYRQRKVWLKQEGQKLIGRLP